MAKKLKQSPYIYKKKLIIVMVIKNNRIRAQYYDYYT